MEVIRCFPSPMLVIDGIIAGQNISHTIHQYVEKPSRQSFTEEVGLGICGCLRCIFIVMFLQTIHVHFYKRVNSKLTHRKKQLWF